MAIPISVDSVTSIAAKVNELVTLLPSGNRKVRKDLLGAARSLYLAVETPMEALLRMEWAEPSLNAATQIALDLNLFDKLPEKGEPPRGTSELAGTVGAEPVLLGRILNHLAAMGILHEAGPGLYEQTSLSKALTVPQIRDAVPVGFDLLLPAFAGVRRYLSSNSYENPRDPHKGPFQTGLETDLHFFEWLSENPKIAAQFNNHMAGYSLSRARWCDPGCVPVKDVLAAPDTTDGVLLVDVGGGSGHDIALFKERHAELRGRLVLQDLPNVIEGCRASLPAGIEAMAHDFFTPQPVKGACAYYLHSILHDWPDDRCREILNNITPVMDRGRSKILLNENVISKLDNHWETTGLDLIMMAVFAAQERTEEMWHELLQSVGLRIVKIWNYEKGTESLIETELA